MANRAARTPTITTLQLDLDGEVSSQALSNLNNHRSRIRLDGRLALNTVNLGSLANAQVETKEGNLSNLHTGIVPVVALDLELLAVKDKLQARRSLLDEADSVIEVQLALGLSISTNGDDELEVVLAEGGGGQGALDTLGDDGASAVVERDIRGTEVLEEDAPALALDLLVGVEVVEDVLGEVGGDGGGVLLDDGADEDAGAEEVLGLDAKGVGVLGVLVEERAD